MNRLDPDDVTSSRPSFDLSPSRRSLAKLDELPVGARIYAGRSTIGERHLAEMHQRLRARGLEAVEIGTRWFELRLAVKPSLRPVASPSCVPCGGEVRWGRCRRCGTRPAPVEVSP